MTTTATTVITFRAYSLEAAPDTVRLCRRLVDETITWG